MLLLGPAAAHELHWHRVRELYCLPFAAEIPSPGCLPLFLSENLLLISSSVHRMDYQMCVLIFTHLVALMDV